MASQKKNGKKVLVVDSRTNFDKMIDEAGNKHILVEFYATWCGPCAIIGPRLEQLANEYADRLVILKIDVDDHEELALEYEVTSMPTFLIIKNKVKLAQFVGSNSEKVESALEKYCGKPERGSTTAAAATATATAATSTATTTTATSAAVTGTKAGTSREVKDTGKTVVSTKSTSPPTMDKKLPTKQ